MKSIVYRKTGDPSVLRLAERDVPEPGPGEVRVRVVVSGVNPTDWKTRTGATAQMAFPEVTPRLDGAGVIDAVGAGVAGYTVGDRVWVYLATGGRPTGTAQEFTVVPAARAVRLPDAASFDVGAALGVPAITAHRALTVAEDGPAGVDVVAEVAPAPNLALDLAVLRDRGTVAVYADNGGDSVTLDVRANMAPNARWQFLLLYTVGEEALATAAEDITAALAGGALPVGAEHGLPLHRFPPTATADAHAAVEADAVGKVLVDVHPL